MYLFQSTLGCSVILLKSQGLATQCHGILTVDPLLRHLSYVDWRLSSLQLPHPTHTYPGIFPCGREWCASLCLQRPSAASVCRWAAANFCPRDCLRPPGCPASSELLIEIYILRDFFSPLISLWDSAFEQCGIWNLICFQNWVVINSVWVDSSRFRNNLYVFWRKGQKVIITICLGVGRS